MSTLFLLDVYDATTTTAQHGDLIMVGASFDYLRGGIGGCGVVVGVLAKQLAVTFPTSVDCFFLLHFPAEP